MQLNNLITNPYLANEKELSKQATKLVCDFILSITNRQRPSLMVTTYSNLFHDIDAMWMTNCRKHLKISRTVKSILLKSLPSYSLSQFAQEKLNFTFHHQGKFKRMKYSYLNFLEMAKMETAMLVFKYETVYEFEIEIAVVSLLLKYFEIYQEDMMTLQQSWTLQASEIRNVINAIMSMELSELKRYTDLIDVSFMLHRKSERKEDFKMRPTCKEDLEKCFIEGMTQKEKRRAVMEGWNITSEKCAQRLMAQYGLTRSYNKDAQPEATAEAVTELHSVIPDVCAERDRLKQENERLRAEIETLKSQMKECLSLQKRLKNPFDSS